MSEDSVIPNQKKSENAVSGNSLCKSGKKLKRNYCYVCKVQCTAPKNYLAHQNGKKHIKNLKIQEKKSRNSKTKNNSQKNVVKCSVSHEQNSNKSKIHETQDLHSGTENSLNETMNSSNRRRKPRNKKYEYISPKFENRFSRYQNAKYSYSNSYRNQEYYYKSGPHHDYARWNPTHSLNVPLMPNSNYHNSQFSHQHYTDSEYKAPHQNDYFSDNRHSFFNSKDSLDANSYLPFNESENSQQNSDRSFYNVTNLETSEEKEFQSNSSEHSGRSNKKFYLEGRSSALTETNPKESIKVCLSNLNQSAVSTPDTDKSNVNSFQASSPALPNSNITKLGEKKQMRHRSVSTSESFSSERRIKDKNENQSLDSDSASEEQRIKKWTASLLDTNHNGLSRLINPSNYKEKAAVNHLITKLSKSKRKENLTRKLRSNSLGSTDMNDDDTEDANTTVESVSTEYNEISIILDSNVIANENNSNLEQNDSCPPTVKESKKKYAKSNNSNLEQNGSCPPTVKESKKKYGKSNNSNQDRQFSRNSSKVDGRSKESNVCISSKKSEKRRKISEYVNSEKSAKRKSLSGDSGSKGKKSRVHSTEYAERPIISGISELRDGDTPVIGSSFCPPHNLKAANPVSVDVLSAVKDEVTDSSGINTVVPSTSTNAENLLDQETLEMNSEISVETLIQLFASGNVTVKEEFNDPVVDAIKEISSDELINACSNQQFPNKESEAIETPLSSNIRSSKDKSDPGTSSGGSRECVSPIILGSAVVNENTAPVSITKSSSLSPNLSSRDVNNSTENQNLNLFHKTNSELSPYLNKLIKQLQEISSQEEIVKQNLSEAKSKIIEYSSLLEDWKSKKKKLQDEEEELRKQRNDIIKLMQNAVKTSGENTDKEPKTSTLPEKKLTDQTTSNKIQKKLNDNIEIENSSRKSDNSLTSVSLSEKDQKQKNKAVSSDSDEITILPSPIKSEPPEIIIFDDAEENLSVTQDRQTNTRKTRNEMVSDTASSKGPPFFDEKNMIAHSTIINCLVVFEDFLYTCSNDNTAKRFSLKDTSLTVTYLHSAKNVTEIVVEKVQNEALVFTSCSTRVISLFIASNGTKIKTFFPLCAVMSICKGWGKFYAGLANGAVNVYNWKYEEKEVVKTEYPTSRIATAHQGRLHVLVILSSDGNISIRDAETGLLIRCIKMFVKQPAWMTVYNDLAYVSSADKTLIILDIMSGREEKRLYLNSYNTGLAASEDFIFTISYSGTINCFNKDKSCDRRLYYGAGKNGLTCIHVYQDWVLTGNRKGIVSLFHFDPFSTVTCKCGKCDIIFGLKEDLEYHVERDHISKKKSNIKCLWRTCDYSFPKHHDENAKMDHMRKHIYQVHV